MPSGKESTEPPLRFTTHGKLLLFGEHAAVYGYPALGVSLDCRLNLEVTHFDPPPGGDPVAEFPGLSAREASAAAELLASARGLLPELSIPPGSYALSGNVPRSAGFGSSAAVCVNLARYFFFLAQQQGHNLEGLLPKHQHSSHWPEEEKNQYLLWHIANHLEKVFHGSPSGIDTGLAALGGIRAFFPRSRKLPDHMALKSAGAGIWLIYGAVSREGNTRTLVGELQAGMLEENPKVVNAMEELGELAHSAIECFQDTDIAERDQVAALGELAQKAHARLAGLNLNTDGMDRILEKARKLGSPGGKLSGAGGGGAFYFLADGEQSAHRMREQLTVFCREKGIELLQPLSIIKI
jgi:mevalonate kinase